MGSWRDSNGLSLVGRLGPSRAQTAKGRGAVPRVCLPVVLSEDDRPPAADVATHASPTETSDKKGLAHHGEASPTRCSLATPARAAVQ